MKKQYIEIERDQKLELLNEHSMGDKWNSLDDSQWCWHCESQFTGHSVRIYQDERGGPWLECGTPNCDGSPLDWADHPWWDPNHPATQSHPETKARQAFEKMDSVTKSTKPEKN